MIQSVLLTAAPAQPPREFRIFRAGANPSTKGTFQFGPAEASAVMSAWRAEGSHRLPIDVEHDSLDPAARASRADAGDAVGWFTPELRGGELWATQVEFGPAGLERLAKKSQTYFSPAFSADAEGRVTALVNVALVSMPALHALDQLVAAGKYGAKSSTTLHTRVTSETAAVFRLLAKQANVAPGVMIRRCLVALAAAPADAADSSLVAIRKALGLEPDAGRGEIVEALDALFTLIGGDPADAPASDPTAASAPPAPAKLSKDEARACARHGLVPTPANFEKLKRSMVRTTERKPARAAVPATLSKSEITAQVVALPLDVRRAALAKFASLEDFIVARAATVRRA
jgi:phage I-like protein